MELFAPLDPKRVDVLEGYLDLPQSERDRIQKDYQSPTQRKEAYLDIYVHQHPCPTWRQVAKLLRNWVYLPQQADLVENTYVKGTQDTLYNNYTCIHMYMYYQCACVIIGSPTCIYCCTYPPYQCCVYYDTAGVTI